MFHASLVQVIVKSQQQFLLDSDLALSPTNGSFEDLIRSHVHYSLGLADASHEDRLMNKLWGSEFPPAVNVIQCLLSASLSMTICILTGL